MQERKWALVIVPANNASERGRAAREMAEGTGAYDEWLVPAICFWVTTIFAAVCCLPGSVSVHCQSPTLIASPPFQVPVRVPSRTLADHPPLTLLLSLHPSLIVSRRTICTRLVLTLHRLSKARISPPFSLPCLFTQDRHHTHPDPRHAHLYYLSCAVEAPGSVRSSRPQGASRLLHE